MAYHDYISSADLRAARERDARELIQAINNNPTPIPMKTIDIDTETLADLVSDWLGNHAERLDCLFDDTTAYLNWQREAIEQSAVCIQTASDQSSFIELARRFQIRWVKMLVAEVCERLASDCENAHA